MKYSFIIPCLNEEKYIGVLLNNIINSKILKCDYEIIIVDNDCSDSTVSIVWNTASQNLDTNIHIIHEFDRGVSRARNAGAFSAIGRFFIFLDADNMVSDKFLDELESSANQNLAGATICTKSDEINLLGTTFFILLEFVKKIGFRPFGKSIISRETYNKVGGFNNEIKLGENVDFLSRVKSYSKKNKLNFIHIKSPIFCSLRRFHKIGYILILKDWGKAYFGKLDLDYSPYDEL